MPKRFVVAAIFILMGVWRLFSMAPITGGDDVSLFYLFSGKTLGRASWYTIKFQSSDEPLFAPAETHGGKVLIHFHPSMPYRDFGCEYPPAALPTFLIPRLISDDIENYYHLFMAEMALPALGLGWICYRIAQLLYPKRSVLEYVSASWAIWVWASGRLLLHRFDVLVVFFVALGILYFLRRRWGLAGIWFGFGIALKVYPIFLLLPASILAFEDRRWQPVARMLVGAAILPLVTHLVMLPWTGTSVFTYLAYHGNRGIEVETLWTQLILFFDNPGNTVYSKKAYGCDQLFSAYSLHPWITASYICMLATNALAAGIAAFSILPLRSTSIRSATRVNALFLATIVFTVVFAKVLSIQYLFWMFPMAMLMPGKAGRTISICYAIALELGTFWFPAYWVAVAQLTTPFMILVFIRNVLLLVIGAIATWAAITFGADEADETAMSLPQSAQISALTTV